MPHVLQPRPVPLAPQRRVEGVPGGGGLLPAAYRPHDARSGRQLRVRVRGAGLQEDARPSPAVDGEQGPRLHPISPGPGVPPAVTAAGLVGGRDPCSSSAAAHPSLQAPGSLRHH